MKRLSLLSKICFILGFTGIIGCLIMSIILKKEYFWQLMTLLWMGSAFINELRIKQLEEKL